jgi:hypothetical protein
VYRYTPDNNTPGTKRRTQAQLADVARRKTRKRIPYDQFVQVGLCNLYSVDP